jgi:hypothetical protein
MKITGFILLLAGFASVAFAGSVSNAPEVDAGYVTGAVVLIGGAALMIRSRLRK